MPPVKMRRLLVLALVAVASGLLFQVVQQPHLRALVDWEYWSNLHRVGQVMRLVNTHYVEGEEASYESLADSALDGMLSGLDRHSNYLQADEFEDLVYAAEQHYVGIGVEIQSFAEGIRITRVFAGGPSEAAGLRAGDWIRSVGGDSTEGWTLQEVVARLRGPEGSPVALRLYREMDDAYLDVQLRRSDIAVDTVVDAQLLPERIGYLKVTSFGRRTPGEFEAALEQLEGEAELAGLVIDLRNNPGGLLSSAVGVASPFFERGETVVYTESRQRLDAQHYRSVSPRRPMPYPVAVLINEYSASGAEVVAAALQDTGRAIIVGERSVGKGSVQSVFRLPGGRGIRQTTARYFAPSGLVINERGVEPDYPVSMDDRAFFELLMRKRHARFMDAAELAERFGEEAGDIQLQAAADLLLGREPAAAVSAAEAGKETE